MTVAIVGLAGVIFTALLTYLTTRRTASSSELTTVMDESRAMRVELRAEASTLRAEAETLRLRLQKVESLCDRMAQRLAEEGIVVT
jgi:hypothetical protein